MKPTLARLVEGARLTEAEAETIFGRIMEGEATTAQIAGLLTALRARGETPAELRGAVRAARARMRCVAAPPGAIDVCGTGGDGQNTLNVSTAVAFVVAACGVPVAKHGNRALSSRAGGADVLAALGIAQTPAEAEASLATHGLGFFFAPDHHPALRHAAEARRDLGFRTLFNLVGPAANPACVTRQLVGVFSPAWLAPMADTLAGLGAEHVWVVHGAGLDELTLAGPTEIEERRGATARRFTVTPEELGLARAPVAAIAGGDPAWNAAALTRLLDGEPGPYADTVVLNAAAALIVAGAETALPAAAGRARAALASGAAAAKLTALRAPALAA